MHKTSRNIMVIGRFLLFFFFNVDYVLKVFIENEFVIILFLFFALVFSSLRPVGS